MRREGKGLLKCFFYQVQFCWMTRNRHDSQYSVATRRWRPPSNECNCLENENNIASTLHRSWKGRGVQCTFTDFVQEYTCNSQTGCAAPRGAASADCKVYHPDRPLKTMGPCSWIGHILYSSLYSTLVLLAFIHSVLPEQLLGVGESVVILEIMEL